MEDLEIGSIKAKPGISSKGVISESEREDESAEMSKQFTERKEEVI